MFAHENRSPAAEPYRGPPTLADTAPPRQDLKPGRDVTVDGRTINVSTLSEAIEKIETCLRDTSGFALFTLNLDHLTKLRREATFRSLYAQATFVTADGWPVAMLARRQKATIRRTTGADLVLPVCRLAASQDVPIALFGTNAAVLTTVSRILEDACPGLRIVYAEAPPRDFDPVSDLASVSAARIAASGARLCFIALGAPKQEIFTMAARKACPTTGFLCVGASLDYIAGAEWRAPVFFQRLGLEWAWRLSLSPRRLGGRYVRCALLLAELLLFAEPRRLP